MSEEKKNSRRNFIKNGLRILTAGLLAGITGKALASASDKETVWQIDPDLCTACGRCALYCVLDPSAVKCVHAYNVCGYCDLCSGYFKVNAPALQTGSENRLCPTAAIERTYVEDPYYEYVIDEPLCIGCGLCVIGCSAFGNASLFLQIRHDRCTNCNQCNIARECPAGAVKRVPVSKPYLLKGEQRET